MFREVEPFENSLNKPTVVIGHKVEALYFGDDGYFHIETVSYGDNNIKYIYRWRFGKEIPKQLYCYIPRQILRRTNKNIVFLFSNKPEYIIQSGGCVIQATIEMPTMGGVPVKQNGFLEINDPKIITDEDFKMMDVPT